MAEKKTVDVEVFVLVDSDGDTSVGTSEEEVRERHEDDIGALNERSGFRIVKVIVHVPAPEVSVVTLTAWPEGLEEASGKVS